MIRRATASGDAAGTLLEHHCDDVVSHNAAIAKARPLQHLDSVEWHRGRAVDGEQSLQLLRRPVHTRQHEVPVRRQHAPHLPRVHLVCIVAQSPRVVRALVVHDLRQWTAPGTRQGLGVPRMAKSKLTPLDVRTAQSLRVRPGGTRTNDTHTLHTA